MINNNKRWTQTEVNTIKKLAHEGATNEAIAEHMGRTTAAIAFKCSEYKIRRPQVEAPKAKYTRYLSPKKEVSLLWGLFKYSKS